MTPNQIVAYNVAKARAFRGWTQEQAAEALAPYLTMDVAKQLDTALDRLLATGAETATTHWDQVTDTAA